MLAGLIIGILTNVVMQLFKDVGGLGGALIYLVVAAVVIYGSGQMLMVLTVKGFGGALLAAVAIALINYGLLLLSGAVAA